MKHNNLLISLTALVFLFLLAPFVVIFIVSFGRTLAFPPTALTLQWYMKTFAMPMFVNAFKLSLFIALLASAGALIFGVPTAYGIVRTTAKGTSFIETTFTLPLVVPMLVIGFALLRFLVMFGRIPVFLGLLIGHTVLLIPYGVRVTAASLRNFDVRVEEAAISLGASRWRAFFRVVLPNVKTGVLAAFILGFTLSFNNVAISLFLTGPGVTTLPIQMLSYMEYYYNPLIAAWSVIVIILIVFISQAAEKSVGLSGYM